MRTFHIEQEQEFDHPIEEVFAFFADACNLAAITPPWLDFAILNREPVVMAPGALIDYRIKLHGLPLRWRTEITAWEPPHRFVDEQRRGPYRQWIHVHTFTDLGGRTRVRDHVRYQVLGGALVNRLFVAGDVRRIFAHRRRRLLEIFPPRA